MMDAVKIWGKTLRAAMRLNVVKVSRAEFLEKELGHYCAPATIEKIISGEEKTYNLIPIETLDHVAAGCINYQTTVACSIAAVAGVPGGLGLALAIPAYLAQFYGNILALSQKLMYIYGWPDIRDKKGEIDDATLQVLTLFVGVAMGCKEAGKAINAILAKLSDQLIRNIPEKLVTHSAFYSVVRQVASWIGIKISKESLAKGIGKALPLIGAPINAGMTYYTFKPMANRLKKHLRSQALTNIG